MEFPQPKILIPVIIIIILVSVLAFSLANNSKLGLNLPAINTGDNKTQNTNITNQTTNQQTPVNQQNQSDQNNNQAVQYNLPYATDSPYCPNCGSNNVNLLSTSKDKEGLTLYHWYCNYCSHEFLNHGKL